MWPCQTIDEEKDRTLAFLQSLIHTIQHLLLLLLAIAITTQSAKLIVLMKMTNGRQSDPRSVSTHSHPFLRKRDKKQKSQLQIFLQDLITREIQYSAARCSCIFRVEQVPTRPSKNRVKVKSQRPSRNVMRSFSPVIICVLRKVGQDYLILLRQR